jgi:hypothetical protein
MIYYIAGEEAFCSKEEFEAYENLPYTMSDEFYDNDVDDIYAVAGLSRESILYYYKFAQYALKHAKDGV